MKKVTLETSFLIAKVENSFEGLFHMTKLGVGTGCFYRLDMSQFERIEYIESLGVDGVELTLSDGDELDQMDYARISAAVEGFDFVTIHSPIRKKFKETEADRKMLDRIELFRQEIGAETVVFHPDNVESIALLEDVKASIENMQKRKSFDRHDLENFIEEGYPVVIDTVHADTWEEGSYPDEKNYLFSKYAGRINHVHTSVNGPEEEHEPFSDHPEALDGLKNLLVSHKIILESKFSSKDQARKEVGLLADSIDGLKIDR